MHPAPPEIICCHSVSIFATNRTLRGCLVASATTTLELRTYIPNYTEPKLALDSISFVRQKMIEYLLYSKEIDNG